MSERIDRAEEKINNGHDIHTYIYTCARASIAVRINDHPSTSRIATNETLQTQVETQVVLIALAAILTKSMSLLTCHQALVGKWAGAWFHHGHTMGRTTTWAVNGVFGACFFVARVRRPMSTSSKAPLLSFRQAGCGRWLQRTVSPRLDSGPEDRISSPRCSGCL